MWLSPQTGPAPRGIPASLLVSQVRPDVTRIFQKRKSKMISIPCLAPHLVYDNPPITGHVIFATASSCLPPHIPNSRSPPPLFSIYPPHQNSQQVPCQPCKLATFLASLAGPSAPGGGTVTIKNMPHYHLPVLDRWCDHGTGLISKPVKRLSR